MKFDVKYTLPISQMMKGNFNISGYKTSNIGFDNGTKKWTIDLISDKNVHAITNGSQPPFGTKQYVLSQSLGGGQIWLHMNACNDKTHFNCHDGSCISIEKRCNSELDCNDGDDESECNLIDVPQSYLSFVPGNIGLNFKFHISQILLIMVIKIILNLACHHILLRIF